MTAIRRREIPATTDVGAVAARVVAVLAVHERAIVMKTLGGAHVVCADRPGATIDHHTMLVGVYGRAATVAQMLEDFSE
jgi:hypothetical protein